MRPDDDIPIPDYDAELREPHRFPVLSALREEFLGWRFYHQFRTDADSPLRRPPVGVAAQVALAWVLQAPGITSPIVGATKTNQLSELIAAVDIKLTAEEVAALEKPYVPHGILGHAQPTPKSMLK